MASCPIVEDPIAPLRSYHPRGQRRADVTLPVLLSFLGQTQPARLHNLSTGGAMIESAARLRIGDEVRLRCGSVDAMARVVWLQGQRVGLHFHVPLALRETVAQVSRSERVRGKYGTRAA